MKKIEMKDLKDTRALGLALAEKTSPGDVIALTGGLGAGKTTLTKYIAEGLGIEASVTSPTFTIIKEYCEGRMPLYHFDVYRLSGSEEMDELGYEEYFYGDGLTVVEWADIVEDILPEACIRIRIESTGGEERACYIEGAEEGGL